MTVNHKVLTDSHELAESVLGGATPRFHPHTGQELADAPVIRLSPSTRAGLEVPRYCQLCGRRLVVQVRPDGWRASCSRHGELDSVYLDRR